MTKSSFFFFFYKASTLFGSHSYEALYFLHFQASQLGTRGHLLLPADILIMSDVLSSADKDVSSLLLKESLSIAQCGAFKIELSGINEPILPRRPQTPPSLFVRLNVFTASFSARQGVARIFGWNR